MKVMAFNGSPRKKKWNTVTLLKHVLKGAASVGAKTELIQLYDLNYSGCISCFSCKKINRKKDGICSVQDDLTFAGERLTRGRHRIHPYPAMLHPLLVDYLLEKYAKNNDLVLDPFCGSGVTLLQSSFKGYESIGFDINPLALQIARTKTQSVSRRDS